MLNPDTILAAIAAVPPPKEYPRSYLGASEIGDPCARKLWLKFNCYVEPEQFDARMHRLFFRGKREEPVLESLLESIGFKIVQSCLDQAGFKDGFFSGHGDGIYEYDGDRVACEFKTHSLKQFNTLERGQLRQTHEKHYAQCIVYQHKFECAYALYVAVCKDDDRIFIDVIPPNLEHYKEYRDKAEYITTTDKPPERIASKPSDYRCKMCHAHAVCWGLQMPRVNCRNCASSDKEPLNGKFLCEINKELDASGSCERHAFNPYAIQDLLKWDTIEFFPEHRAVKYKKPDGETIVNGAAPFGVPSKELEL